MMGGGWVMLFTPPPPPKTRSPQDGDAVVATH